MVLHGAIRKKILGAIDALNRGDFDTVTNTFLPDAEHAFPGNSCLGGTRRTSAGRKAWYARLRVVFPGIRFDVDRIYISGSPWNGAVTVEWTTHVTDRAGKPLVNQGVFVFGLAAAKVKSLHVYLDTSEEERIFAILRSQGVKEVDLPPITD